MMAVCQKYTDTTKRAPYGQCYNNLGKNIDVVLDYNPKYKIKICKSYAA